MVIQFTATQSFSWLWIPIVDILKRESSLLQVRWRLVLKESDQWSINQMISKYFFYIPQPQKTKKYFLPPSFDTKDWPHCIIKNPIETIKLTGN